METTSARRLDGRSTTPADASPIRISHAPIPSGRHRRAAAEAPRYRAITHRHFDRLPQLDAISADDRFAMQVVSRVLPVRTSEYVVNELIDWSRVPDDPMYQMTFPQAGMLEDADFQRVADLVTRGASKTEFDPVVSAIRARLNPHPAGQRELNIPRDPQGARDELAGIQHKYRETVLFFPSRGQTCHAYCSFCFRWAQFVGNSMKIHARQTGELHRYLVAHPEVTDLLITGGDPMIMKTKVIERYLRPLIDGGEGEGLRSIRIGTKALTFWPHRFVDDDDADDLLRLFEQVVASGKHLAIMAHLNHWQELATPLVRQAIRRLRATGAVIRAQAPVLKHINDDASVWQRLWQDEVDLGIVPYYLFVERDTGARRYFEVPLERTRQIYNEAVSKVSGLARTVRGPSMSAGPGKVEVVGVQEVGGEKVFVLRFLQGRNPNWVGKPFFAKFDAQATWLDQLKPAFGESRFFYEDEYDAMHAR